MPYTMWPMREPRGVNLDSHRDHYAQNRCSDGMFGVGLWCSCADMCHGSLNAVWLTVIPLWPATGDRLAGSFRSGSISRCCLVSVVTIIVRAASWPASRRAVHPLWP